MTVPVHVCNSESQGIRSGLELIGQKRRRSKAAVAIGNPDQNLVAVRGHNVLFAVAVYVHRNSGIAFEVKLTRARSHDRSTKASPPISEQRIYGTIKLDHGRIQLAVAVEIPRNHVGDVIS